VTAIDLLDIANDSASALVGKRTDEKYEKCRDERENAALRQTGETQTQAGLLL
jgi:hypothetical protein